MYAPRHAELCARARCTSRRAGRGFSLIELMVVVGIIGIISAIAYPSYRQYVLQSNRTDAIRTLTANAQILQRCYSQYFSYTNGACPATLPAATPSPNGHYNINNTAVTATTYSLVATPVGSQIADTTCASFTLDQTGKESALNSASADESQTCWGGS